MSKLLKGEQALLLAEACKIDKEKKEKEARIAEIRIEIKLKKAGTYKNQAGDMLTIAETEKWTDIDPLKLKNYLKRNNSLSKFFGLVKVQMTPLKKLVPETAINKMRSKLDSSLRWSFK